MVDQRNLIEKELSKPSSREVVQHGRKKGSKNKKTLAREAAAKTATESASGAAQAQQQPVTQSQRSKLLEELSRRLGKDDDSDSDDSEGDDPRRPPEHDSSEHSDEEDRERPCRFCRPYIRAIMNDLERLHGDLQQLREQIVQDRQAANGPSEAIQVMQREVQAFTNKVA